MPSARASKADGGLWLAALVGAIAFVGVTGGAILDPRETDWLFTDPDPATGFLGWQFFRAAPLAQLPFGANPGYGMEIATSVVFTDSIPLFAFLFKPFSSVLPANFQYFGLWVALSFILQAAFAYRLLLRFSPDRAFALIGAAFFAFAPVCLFRLSGHYALFGQWTVLAALYLYFAPRPSLKAWLALLAVTALIHFYLLAMVGVIWALADLWQRRWRGELTTYQAALHLLAGAALTAAVLWFAGYFMIGNAAGAPGFGIYRMNLLALVDPEQTWSRVLPDQPGGEGDYEGFNYLGGGMLLLAALAGQRVLARRSGAALERPTLVPLLCAALLLSLIALSNRVALGDVELLAYEVPAALEPFADLLRSSGRMFWPVYYLLYLAILMLAFRGLSRRAALGACALALLVQLADSAPALRRYNAQLAHAPKRVSPLKSALWAEIAARYRRVVYVLPRNGPEIFLPWAAFAAEHGLAINFGYFARVDSERLSASRNATEAAVLAQRLAPDTLYVFDSAALWNMASAQPRAGDALGVLDGYRIIAPGLNACATCDLRALADLKREESPGYRLGERITFATASRGYATAGWSAPDGWGMWSQASSATLVLRIAQMPAGEAMLTIEARAFLNEAHRSQSVDVSVNGVPLGTVTFTSSAAEAKVLTIPRAAFAGSKGLLRIGFAFRDARPRALGLMALRLSET
jgi:hypothetical protein